MSEVVDILRENDINADDYIRGPLGRNVFAISIQKVTNEGQIRLWPGLANIDVYPDKKRRQAVLSIDESHRSITKTYKRWTTEPQARNEALRVFRRSVALPSGAKLKTGEPIKIKDAETRNWDRNYGLYSTKVIATLPNNRQTLLVGMDETYHFIAALRNNKIKSVEEAHEALRPEGITEDSLRQGEWFFVPVDEKEEERLDDIAATNPQRVSRRNFERGSGHYGMQVIRRDGENYATGYVYDDRNGTHHKGLFLPSWYKVVRNREIDVTRETTSRIGRLRRTWD